MYTHPSLQRRLASPEQLTLVEPMDLSATSRRLGETSSTDEQNHGSESSIDARPTNTTCSKEVLSTLVSKDGEDCNPIITKSLMMADAVRHNFTDATPEMKSKLVKLQLKRCNCLADIANKTSTTPEAADRYKCAFDQEHPSAGSVAFILQRCTTFQASMKQAVNKSAVQAIEEYREKWPRMLAVCKDDFAKETHLKICISAQLSKVNKREVHTMIDCIWKISWRSDKDTMKTIFAFFEHTKRVERLVKCIATH